MYCIVKYSILNTQSIRLYSLLLSVIKWPLNGQCSNITPLQPPPTQFQRCSTVHGHFEDLACAKFSIGLRSRLLAGRGWICMLLFFNLFYSFMDRGIILLESKVVAICSNWGNHNVFQKYTVLCCSTVQISPGPWNENHACVWTEIYCSVDNTFPSENITLCWNFQIVKGGLL